MALALRRQMNAEMRHVALASARVPVEPSYQGAVSPCHLTTALAEDNTHVCQI